MVGKKCGGMIIKKNAVEDDQKNAVVGVIIIAVHKNIFLNLYLDKRLD